MNDPLSLKFKHCKFKRETPVGYICDKFLGSCTVDWDFDQQCDLCQVFEAEDEMKWRQEAWENIPVEKRTICN